jgi:hypothetical protein
LDRRVLDVQIAHALDRLLGSWAEIRVTHLYIAIAVVSLVAADDLWGWLKSNTRGLGTVDLAFCTGRTCSVCSFRSLNGGVGLAILHLLPLAICVGIVELGFKVCHSSAIRADEVWPVRAIYDNPNALVVPGMRARCYKE